MKNYSDCTKDELQAEYDNLKKEYDSFTKKGLALDMSRGKPSSDQLDLSMGMLDVLDSKSSMKTTSGVDVRNYGVLDGIDEAKKLFADLLEISEKNVFVAGNSSLNLMYDSIARAMIFGVCGSTPWAKLDEQVTFLCPVPGYDRHFSMCESFNIKMINIPTDENGPDMKLVQELVEKDASIKGIWCVPMYSNPSGATYSNDVVKQLVSLKPKADDFRVYWDNAYCVHHLTNEPTKLLNVLDEAEKAGNPDIVLQFASFSKITFSGGGVAVISASENNLNSIKKLTSMQTIGHDKVNQLRHCLFFKDANGIHEHMKKHADIIKPKFQAVIDALEKEIISRGIGSYINPLGGYFISFDTNDGCAKRVYALCKDAGVTLTPAGASFPYGVDDKDTNIRIAPTFPPVSELNTAMELFCICVRMASIEALLK